MIDNKRMGVKRPVILNYLIHKNKIN